MEQINGTLSGIGALSGTLNLSGGGGGAYPHYHGAYTVTPLAQSATILDTNGRVMDDDVTVLKIPYYETSNESGKTVYIADEV